MPKKTKSFDYTAECFAMLAAAKKANNTQSITAALKLLRDLHEEKSDERKAERERTKWLDGCTPAEAAEVDAALLALQTIEDKVRERCGFPSREPWPSELSTAPSIPAPATT